MIDIEDEGFYVEVSVFFILLVVLDEIVFCIIEYFMFVKFNIFNLCYTGFVIKENLVILTCLYLRYFFIVVFLNKCY